MEQINKKFDKQFKNLCGPAAKEVTDQIKQFYEKEIKELLREVVGTECKLCEYPCNFNQQYKNGKV